MKTTREMDDDEFEFR